MLMGSGEGEAFGLPMPPGEEWGPQDQHSVTPARPLQPAELDVQSASLARDPQTGPPPPASGGTLHVGDVKGDV